MHRVLNITRAIRKYAGAGQIHQGGVIIINHTLPNLHMRIHSFQGGILIQCGLHLGQDLAIPKAAGGLQARRYMPRKKVFVFLCDSIYCVLPFFLAISGTKSAPCGRQEAMQRALPACACGSYATTA